MYVCICNAVNERRILQAIENGTKTWKALSHELNIGTQCGKCALHAKAFFEAELAKRGQPQVQE
jgi:bacterioferritin-associated ferredoxin